MKRTILALALAAVLAACGDPEPVPAPDYSEAEEVLEETATTVTTLAPDPAQSCDQIGHPYPAKPGDPHDGDGDGTACDEAGP